MNRKHTRRAAKAAFAISFGVAIVIGLFAGRVRRRGSKCPDGRDRNEELPRGVHPRAALQAGAGGEGLRRQYKENIGSTELIQTSLTSGKINFYPEYTGVIVQDVFHHKYSPKTPPRPTRSRRSSRRRRATRLLNATPFYDTDVLAVTNATAKKYGLNTIGDLGKVGSFKLGGFPECQTRNTCFLGYTKQYGLTNATFVPLGGSPRTRRSTPGKVLAADVFSTDPPLGKARSTRCCRPEARDRLPERGADREDLAGDGAGPEFTKTVNAVQRS